MATPPKITPLAIEEQQAINKEGQTILDRMPPTMAICLAIIAIQVGASVAIQLFPALGAEGTAAVRIVFSAIMLGLVARGQIYTFKQVFMKNKRVLIMLGLSVSVMNFFFYKSLELIPLGAAVAIDFIGPLGVAAITSRRASHFAWIIIAATGIILLSPLSGTDLDPLGIFYALLTASGWASFIILAGRISKQVPGNSGLTIAMIIASITMIPFFLPIVSTLTMNPLILLAGLGVALLSTSIPFSLEFHALKRMPALLISLEPAVAALVGVFLLDEYIGIQGIMAIACIIIAAIGMALSKH